MAEPKIRETVEALLNQGKLEEAQDASERAVAEAERKHGSESGAYGQALVARASVLLAQNGLQAAHDQLKEAVTVFEQIGTTRPSDLADALLSLGTLLHLLDNVTDAESSIRKALALSSDSAGGNVALHARCLIALGDVLDDQYRSSEAETAYRQAYDISSRFLGRDHPKTIAARDALGGFLLRIGEVEESEPHIRQAFDIAMGTLPESHPDVAMAMSNLGELLAEIGIVGEAEHLLTRALELTDQYRGRQSLDAARAATVLGMFFRDEGRFSQAEELLSRAMDIHRLVLGERHTCYARSLTALGAVLQSLHVYDRACEHFFLAFDIDLSALGEGHPRCAHHLIRISDMCMKLGEEDRAIIACRQAMRIIRNHFGSSHLEFAAAMEHFSELLTAAAKYKSAIEWLERAKAIRKKNQGEQDSAYLSCLAALAYAQACVGELHEAKVLLCRVADTYRNLGRENDPQYASLLVALAAIAVREHRPDRALSMVVDAMSIERRIAHHAFAVSSESRRQGMLLHLSMYLAMVLSLTKTHLEGEEEAVKQAFDAIVRQKGLDGEVHLVQRIWGTDSQNEQLHSRLDDLHELRQQLAVLLFRGASAQRAGAKSSVGDLCDEIDEMEADLARQIPLAELARQLEKADGDAVLLNIPEDCALVEFARVPVWDIGNAFESSSAEAIREHYFAIVVCPSGVQRFQFYDLGEAESIDAKVAALRTVLSPADGSSRGVGIIRDRSVSEFREAAIEVRETVFDPLLPALENVNDLILAPDGDLCLLSFCILPFDDGEYLIDRYTIHYVGSSRELVRLSDVRARTTEPAVVIADPDFDCLAPPAATAREDTEPTVLSRGLVRADLAFPNLPGTRQEGQMVAELLGSSPPLFGSDATVHRVMVCHSPHVLHVATHGFFCSDQEDECVDSDDAPLARRIRQAGRRLADVNLDRESDLLRSGLVFAGVNAWASGKDLPPEMRCGILTAFDVLGIDLLGTELVVLSACDTGLGAVRCGEGVFGLRRAFTLAGAKAMVMSLWRVGDQDAQEMMSVFYQRLLDGTPRAAALREAQLALRKHNPDPAAWGPFICQGDPGVLLPREAVT